MGACDVIRHVHTRSNKNICRSFPHYKSPWGRSIEHYIFQTRNTSNRDSTKELIDKKPYPILSHIMAHKHTFLLAETISLGNNKPAGVKRLKDYNNLKIKIKDLLDLI